MMKRTKYIMEVAGLCVSRYAADGPGGKAGDPVLYFDCEATRARMALSAALGVDVHAVEVRLEDDR